MDRNVCRAGHRSTEADYCSVCGTAMSPAAPESRSVDAVCPECGEPRPSPTAGARFCEVCRFDFGVDPAGGPRTSGWELSVETDPALDDERDSATPAQPSARTVPFDRPELLVGRRDEQRDIHPELPLDDPGASRRHLKLLRPPGGEILLHDLASTNGTWVNGERVAPGTRRALRDGDQVTLGRWTRLVLRAVR